VPDLSWENAKWLWGWIWWLISGGWPVLVAIPGLVAFWWQRSDRKAKREAETPYIRVEDGSSTGVRADWKIIRICVRNDARVPVEIRSLSVGKPYVLAKLDGKNRPDLRAVGQSIQLSRRVATSESDETYAFVGSTERSMSQVQLSMRAQYSEQSASRRDRTIKMKSEAIDVPHITISKTSNSPIA
jgi:hypothetical protein